MAELTTGDLRRLEGQVSRLGSLTELVVTQVDHVKTNVGEMDTRLTSLSQQFNEFVLRDTLAKELQLAETRIVKVRDEIQREFGHYGEVRRQATGLLQALDTGVVSHETIQDTTEEVMVKSPRYWLAPALVALAAWSRNDRPLAERALAEALRRDTAKASLFLSLVLRRYRRDRAATRWLAQFFARQDPAALGREFIVVLDAVATGAYGVAGREVAVEEINSWLRDMEQEVGFLQRQVDRWQDALVALRPAPVSGRFGHLESHCAEWSQLADSLASASMHGQVVAHFTAIFDGELRLPAALERAMDDMLDRLVKDFDVEELPLRRQESELQAVIDHDGDRARAVPDAKLAQAALEETVDFPSLLTNAAMRPKEAGASRGSERLAVALSREWIVQAHDALTARSRNSVLDTLTVKIDSWTGKIGQDASADALAADLRATIDRETQAQIAAVRFGFGGWATSAAAGLLLLIGLISLSPLLIVIALGLGGWAYWQYKQIDKRKEAVRVRGEDRKRNDEHKLQATFAELVDYQTEWQREDARAEEARTLLTAISPIDQVRVSTYDAREVL